MITVDKINVPEPVVQTQEGFWRAAVGFYQHWYQPTGNPPPPQHLPPHTHTHKHAWSHSAQAAWGCVDRCLSGLFDISVPHPAAHVCVCWGVTLVCDQRRARASSPLATWQHACSAGFQEGDAVHGHHGGEKLRREDPALTQSQQWFMNVCTALGDGAQCQARQLLLPLTPNANWPHDG